MTLLPCNSTAVTRNGRPLWLRWERICLQCRRPRFNPWFGNIPWRRKWQPTPVFLPKESRGHRSLVGYSPQGHKRVRHDWAINSLPGIEGQTEWKLWRRGIFQSITGSVIPRGWGQSPLVLFLSLLLLVGPQKSPNRETQQNWEDWKVNSKEL